MAKSSGERQGTKQTVDTRQKDLDEITYLGTKAWRSTMRHAYGGQASNSGGNLTWQGARKDHWQEYEKEAAARSAYKESPPPGPDRGECRGCQNGQSHHSSVKKGRMIEDVHTCIGHAPLTAYGELMFARMSDALSQAPGGMSQRVRDFLASLFKSVPTVRSLDSQDDFVEAPEGRLEELKKQAEKVRELYAEEGNQ